MYIGKKGASDMILSEKQTIKIKELQKQIRELNLEDWMCEGADDSQLVFFNNSQDKVFYTNFYGNITSNPDNVHITPDLKKLIELECRIEQICQLAQII